jgi:hypothetical protein
VGVRRYRVKYSVYGDEGGYSVKTREFRSLRNAGEFLRDMPANHEFNEIKVVEYGPLTPDERNALCTFSDGRFRS